MYGRRGEYGLEALHYVADNLKDYGVLGVLMLVRNKLHLEEIVYFTQKIVS